MDENVIELASRLLKLERRPYTVQPGPIEGGCWELVDENDDCRVWMLYARCAEAAVDEAAEMLNVDKTQIEVWQSQYIPEEIA